MDEHPRCEAILETGEQCESLSVGTKSGRRLCPWHYQNEMADEITRLTSALAAALARVREVEEENARLRNLPAVGGSYVEGTLAGLAHRAQIHLGIEQEKALPDNALIAVLCDTVRMVREWERHTDAHVQVRLAAARAEGVRGFAEWLTTQPSDCQRLRPISDLTARYLASAPGTDEMSHD
jgi:hypothetical protein